MVILGTLFYPAQESVYRFWCFDVPAECLNWITTAYADIAFKFATQSAVVQIWYWIKKQNEEISQVFSPQYHDEVATLFDFFRNL